MEDNIYDLAAKQQSSVLLGDSRGQSPDRFQEMMSRFSFLVKHPVRADFHTKKSSQKYSASPSPHNQSVLALTPFRFKEIHVNASFEAQRKRMRRLAGLDSLSKPQRTSLKYKGILVQQAPKDIPRRRHMQIELGANGRSILPPIDTQGCK